MTESKPNCIILEEGQTLVRLPPTDDVAEDWERLAVRLGRLRRALYAQSFQSDQIDVVVARCLEYYLQSRYPFCNGKA